ncbi:MAG: hypothetical protein BroJett025_00560 [Patescibacteria group bacterium]|nr:MAG: hypothetical protein BroJett025_00560 [Patescibacteria group bacterium]
MQETFSSRMLLIVILLILAGIATYFIANSNRPAQNGDGTTVPTPAASPDEQVFCTLDAKQCPDGSYVGRVPPNCEFAPCPDFDATDDPDAMMEGSGEVQVDPIQLQVSY